jgi:hypothetical protein
MVIARKFSGKKRRIAAVAATAVLAGAGALASTGVAHATAQTCVAAPGNTTVCTAVSGSGDYVGYMDAAWFHPGEICNYSAWFYYVPPSGGAYGLAYLSRAGCGYAHVWLDAYFNKNFPNGSLMCIKMYENSGNYDGTRCVQLTR